MYKTIASVLIILMLLGLVGLIIFEMLIDYEKYRQIRYKNDKIK